MIQLIKQGIDDLVFFNSADRGLMDNDYESKDIAVAAFRSIASRLGETKQAQ